MKTLEHLREHIQVLEGTHIRFGASLGSHGLQQ